MHTTGPGIWRENCKTWKMRQKTLSDLEHDEKQKKMGKMRNAHCKELQYGKKTENHGK